MADNELILKNKSAVTGLTFVQKISLKFLKLFQRYEDFN